MPLSKVSSHHAPALNHSALVARFKFCPLSAFCGPRSFDSSAELCYRSSELAVPNLPERPCPFPTLQGQFRRLGKNCFTHTFYVTQYRTVLTLSFPQYCRAAPAPKPQHSRAGTTKTVGRWLKDRREKKKEDARAHNAQLHAAVSVAGVAAAVAAIAAATAAASGNGRDDRAARTDMAVASAATLVAAQCVEAAEALGAERDHLTSVVGSAVSIRTPGDIVTLTAAAATALRGAATLKARALKEVWNVAAVIPVEKGGLGGNHGHRHHNQPPLQSQRKNSEGNDGGEAAPQENFLGLCSQELLARGTELLKRTREGALHWKLVSVYINQTGQVMLKTKSRHVAGTITKKKKSVIVDICKDVPAWPGRHLLEGGEHRRYFGLRTAEHRVIEFECRNQREHEMWTRGVSRLLTMANGRNGLMKSPI